MGAWVQTAQNPHFHGTQNSRKNNPQKYQIIHPQNHLIILTKKWQKGESVNQQKTVGRLPTPGNQHTKLLKGIMPLSRNIKWTQCQLD